MEAFFEKEKDTLTNRNDKTNHFTKNDLDKKNKNNNKQVKKPHHESKDVFMLIRS